MSLTVKWTANTVSSLYFLHFMWVVNNAVGGRHAHKCTYANFLDEKIECVHFKLIFLCQEAHKKE